MEYKDRKYISTTEAAKILGISRTAIFNKIQGGDIKAQKVGRNYIIAHDELNRILGRELTDEKKRNIDASVEKTIREYGEALRLLGKE
jgi:excisionase family DNA binding protein